MVDCFASFTDPSDPGPVVYPGDTIVIPGNGIVDTYDETGSGSTSGACGAGAVTLTINDAVAGRIYTVTLNGYGTLTQLDATTWCWTPPSDEDERDSSSIDIKIGEHILYTYVPHFCCRNGMSISGSTSVEPNSETEYTVVFSDPWSGCDYDWNATDGYIVGGTFIAPSTPGVVTISVTPFLADDMGEECATLDVTVESPCGGESIGYTTLQMQVSGSQTLTVVNPVSGKTYYWSASSGSIDASGNSVTYTAPSSNANCTSNPTITLTCGGTQVDSISIAVNQVTSSYAAYEFNGDCQYGCRQIVLSPYYSLCEYYYQYTGTQYSCSGDVYSSTVHGITSASTGCNDTNYPDCTHLKNFCDSRRICADVGGCCNAYTLGLVDLRTSAQKAAGCCPADLL